MLDLDALQATAAVRKALVDYRARTSKPLVVKHVKDWVQRDGYPPSISSPALVPLEGRYEVYVTERLSEHMAVHEITHAILIEEGHPDFEFDAARAGGPPPRRTEFEGLLADCHNKFQHPEVYRRMRDAYGLQMGPYRKYAADRFHLQTEKQIAGGQYQGVYWQQVQFFNVLDLLQLRPQSDRTVKRVEAVSRKLLSAAVAANEELAAIGSSTPQQALTAVTALWNRITDFGKWAGDESANDLWAAVRWFLPARQPGSFLTDPRPLNPPPESVSPS